MANLRRILGSGLILLATGLLLARGALAGPVVFEGQLIGNRAGYDAPVRLVANAQGAVAAIQSGRYSYRAASFALYEGPALTRSVDRALAASIDSDSAPIGLFPGPNSSWIVGLRGGTASDANFAGIAADGSIRWRTRLPINARYGYAVPPAAQLGGGDIVIAGLAGFGATELTVVRLSGSDGSIVWVRTIAASVEEVSIAVDGGDQVYLLLRAPTVITAHQVLALASSNGATLWTNATFGGSESAYDQGAALAGDPQSGVYLVRTLTGSGVASGQNVRAHRLAAANGSVLWNASVALGENCSSAWPVRSSNSLFILGSCFSQAQQSVRLEPASGAVTWLKPLGTCSGIMPTALPGGDLLITGGACDGTAIRRLGALSGDPVWSWTYPAPMDGWAYPRAQTVSGQTVMVSIETGWDPGGVLQRLDLASGTPLGTSAVPGVRFGYARTGVMTNDSAGGFTLAGVTVVRDELANDLADELKWRRYAQSDGHLIWEKTLPWIGQAYDAGLETSPDGSAVYVAQLSDSTYQEFVVGEIDGSTGTTLWNQFRAGYGSAFYPDGVATAANGDVYLAHVEYQTYLQQETRHLERLQRSDGTVLWSTDYPATLRQLWGLGDDLLLSGDTAAAGAPGLEKYSGANGSVAWILPLPGTNPNGLARTLANGDIIFVGYGPPTSASYTTSWRVYRISASTGAISWMTTYEDPNGDRFNLDSLHVGAGDEIYVSGRYKHPSTRVRQGAVVQRLAPLDGTSLWVSRVDWHGQTQSGAQLLGVAGDRVVVKHTVDHGREYLLELQSDTGLASGESLAVSAGNVIPFGDGGGYGDWMDLLGDGSLMIAGQRYQHDGAQALTYKRMLRPALQKFGHAGIVVHRAGVVAAPDMRIPFTAIVSYSGDAIGDPFRASLSGGSDAALDEWSCQGVGGSSCSVPTGSGAADLSLVLAPGGSVTIAGYIHVVTGDAPSLVLSLDPPIELVDTQPHDHGVTVGLGNRISSDGFE